MVVCASIQRYRVRSLAAFLALSFLSAQSLIAAEPAEIRQFRGHTSATTSVAISANGRIAVSGDNDTTVRTWNVETGEATHVLSDHKNYVLCVALTPDGSLALSGGGGEWDAGMTFFGPGTDHVLRMWDVNTGKVVRRFEGHTAPIWCVAVSPDGRRILSGSGGRRLVDGRVESYGHELILWTESGMELMRLEGHTNWVRGVAFSPDGAQGASACWDGIVRIWDLETGLEVRNMNAGNRLNSVAYSPDGRMLLSGGETVELWEVATGKTIRSFPGHADRTWSVAFSPDGLRAVTASEDRTVRLWDIASGRELHRYEGHTNVVRRAVFSPDGQSLLSASHDLTLRLWSLPD